MASTQSPLIRLAAIGTLLASASAFAAMDKPAVLQHLLTTHCTACHDGETRKGQLDLTATSFDLSKPTSFETWVKVYDRVQAGEMPPKSEERPPKDQADAAAKALESALLTADGAKQKEHGRARLRRLSRVEFENTLRDLFSMQGLNVKESLPVDGSAGGFDRVSSALDMSFVHMQSYLTAIDYTLNEALCPLPEMPPVFKHRYQPWADHGLVGTISGKELIGIVDGKRDTTFDVKYPNLIDEEPKAQAMAIFRHEDADKRYSMRSINPVLTGWHRIRVSGYSVWWDGKELAPTDRHGALSFGIYSKGLHFGTVDMPPNKPAEREVIAWIERGGGMTHGTDDNIKLNPASVEGVRDFAYGKNKDVVGPMVPLPGVAVEWVEIEGPLNDQWPPASHKAMFGDLPVKKWTKELLNVPKPVQQAWIRGNPRSLPKDIYGERGQNRPDVYVESTAPAKDAERLLRTFLRRAFRRPVTDAEIGVYVADVSKRIAEGGAFQDAMVAAYRAALSSPEFLLIRAAPGPLDDHALAQRLSYFLWSSMPDAELFALAEKKELGKPAVLRAQAERMLNDPKAKRFVEDFCGQWLKLREIAATQPDVGLYPEFKPWISEAMLMETHAYFSELLAKDLSATQIVKSDFAMINEPLARLYGIEGVKGWDIRRVELPKDAWRGGFLTQGSVLKVTADGTTTSPVKRGAFVMEKILGIHPPPPPPNVGSIEPDVRGATTVREQLDKHRANASCAACHQKMDGYGFALESFDVMGERRDSYRIMGGKDPNRKRVNGHPINYRFGPAVDCSGVMPDGRAFKNVAELAETLASRPEDLASAFASQLLVYGTGAEISFADRAAVAEIVKRSKARNFGMRTILLNVIESELFRNK